MLSGARLPLLYVSWLDRRADSGLRIKKAFGLSTRTFFLGSRARRFVIPGFQIGEGRGCRRFHLRFHGRPSKARAFMGFASFLFKSNNIYLLLITQINFTVL